ncbi:hypothetical protein [uncultured Thermanaerothrix sp.]|uniref:hypothetical protein n=1 Tax=uncultured Thermanaerothrix sp. TaxID=1195149 RepID=UPI00261575F1|nr:hypothetical protein [uncultured Thermanaerothrix sp.]
MDFRSNFDDEEQGSPQGSTGAENPFEEPIEPEPEAGSPGPNRNFLIAAGIIGGIFVLAIIALIVFALVSANQNRARLQQEAAQINAQNTVIAMQATQTSQAFALQQTLLAQPTPTTAATPVIIVPTATPVPTNTLSPENMARTATVAAFLTQVAKAATGTPQAVGPTPTSTALPTTGFADEVGLPGLLGLAAFLILVIMITRRLRFSATR